MESWRQEMLENNYIQHHGILGQKWGVRRFQNPDGSLTASGKKRYNNSFSKDAKKLAKKLRTHSEAYRTYLNSIYKRYYNPETGNVIEIGNGKAEQKSLRTKKEYERFKELMKKKYSTVKSTSNIDTDSGKIEVNVVLEKIGNDGITDFYELNG